jgi:TonB family protein
MKLPMRLPSAFCLFLIFGNLQSQKLVGFKVSKCLTDCTFEKSTIEDLKISNGQTEILLRTLADCNGNFLGKIESRDGILNLTFEPKPIRGTDENGKKAWHIEVALCDCPFDFTYKIKGLELKDLSLIRVNGLMLSELPGPLVEEIQINIGPELEEKEGENQILTIVEEQAAPVGGMSAFYKYVREEMKYPAQARKMQVEGRVFCEFVVNRDGSIQDVRIIRGIGTGCDEEAIRIIQASAPWKPGKQRGKPVRSKFNVAIVFKLN